MSRGLMLGAALACALTGVAANLVGNGDFSRCEKGRLPPECRAEDGVRISLHTEDLTWNRCLKAEVSRAYTNAADGVVKWSGSAFIGAGGQLGFPVEPRKNYDVSVDLRGCGAGVRVSLAFWKGACRNWEDRVSIPVVRDIVRPGKDWRTVKGMVTAPEGAKLAAVQISFFGSSAKGYTPLKIGDWVLADGISCELSRKNLGVSGNAADFTVPVRKALSTSDGTPVTDFLDLKSLKPCAVRTALRVKSEDDAFVLGFMAEEPEEFVAGSPDKVWSGESFEFFFVAEDGGLRHFAFNAAGAQYLDLGDGKVRRGEGWTVEPERTASGWRAKVRVPYALAGFSGRPSDGTLVRFNAGRNRVRARQFITWARTNAGYAQVSAFGTLVVGDWETAIRREFGESRTVGSREAYQKACAEIESARLKAKFERFKDLKFSAAVIPVISDYRIPFLPEEIFDPATNIHLVAAVNEVKALPLAVANLTDRLEDCLVMLETADEAYVGSPGLSGFPSGRIKVRRAARMRDVAGDTPTMRFDPLMPADFACTLSVPSHEAGIVWYDFDTTDVPPGRYSGRIRIIPLGEAGEFVRRKGGGWGDRLYRGKMQTIPVTFEVQAITLPKRAPITSGFYMHVPNEEAYGLAADLGTERHQINVWRFPLTNDSAEVSARIANDRAWAAKRGIHPRFDILYSAYKTFNERWNGRHDPAKTERLWPAFLTNIKRIMNANGVPDDDYWVETLDEPREKDLDELIRAHRMAKEAVPTVKLCVTIAAWALSEARMRELAKVTDVLILWGRSYFTESWKVKLVEDFRAAGGKVCHYMCDTSMRMPLDTYFRQHAWVGERYGLDGNYFYELSKCMKRFGAADFKEQTFGDILYYAFDRPIPSIRSCAFREGVTDVRYLEAVRRAAGDDPEAKAFLDRAAKEVVDLTPRDPKTPDRMREEARRLLLRLTGE